MEDHDTRRKIIRQWMAGAFASCWKAMIWLHSLPAILLDRPERPLITW
jgi:hypothetical protein